MGDIHPGTGGLPARPGVGSGQDGKTIVILLCGGTKKRQSRDIAAAKMRWADYKARKRARPR